MFRWASRINLQLTAVRVEQLQDIGESGAVAEGVEPYETAGLRGWKPYLLLNSTRKSDRLLAKSMVCTSARASFQSLWASINAKRAYGWGANPWVWALTYELESVKSAKSVDKSS